MRNFISSIALAIALTASLCGADYVTHDVTVELAATQSGKWKTIVASEIGAPDDADLLWHITTPQAKRFALSDDQSQIAFWISRESVEVLCDWVDFTNHKRGLITVRVNADGPTPPDPGPGPKPPDPKPPAPKPEGLAGVIYEAAIKVNRPADCLKMSDNFWAVTIGIQNARKFQQGDRAAPEPKYFNVGQAMQAVAQANKAAAFDASWKEFGKWLEDEAYKNMTSIDQLHAFYYAASAGLKAAGGVKQ